MIVPQLEFSLLAVHDDPIPRLQEQLAQLQAAGHQSEASELAVKLATENSKRERWAVSLTFVTIAKQCDNSSPDTHSSKIACGGITT